MSGTMPYRFLDSYQLGDEALYFGRKRETRILLADIVANRLVVLFARTGTGKTSLINAGVRPLLHERGYATLPVRVRKDPVESILWTLRTRDEGPIVPTGETLSAQLESVADQLDRPVVFFLDQFEEFFVYHLGQQPEQAASFIEEMATICERTESRVHIVMSMREEFFGGMDAFRDAIPTIFHNESNLRLRWFDLEQAREAIEGPPRVFDGTTVAEDLVQRLLADLAEDGAVEPAKLQIVCDSLWREEVRRRTSRPAGPLTLDHYEVLGRDRGRSRIFEHIINRRLEDQFARIDSEQQLKLLERLLPRLRTRRGTKYIWDLALLAKVLETDEGSLGELLERLSESRLVALSAKSEGGAQLFVELTHDYLVNRLPDLRRRVRLIWPRRVLESAIGDGVDRSPPIDELALATILQHGKRLSLTAPQAELLFRSALLYGGGRSASCFRLARASGVDVWGILAQSLASPDSREAIPALNFLARVQTKRAFRMLQQALGRDELARHLKETFLPKRSLAVVNFLEALLDHPGLSSRARSWLEQFANAPSKLEPEVSARAATALSSHAPPGGSRSTFEQSTDASAHPTAQAEDTAATRTDLGSRLTGISTAMTRGRLVLILGAGIHAAGRPVSDTWHPDSSRFFPLECELSAYLAAKFGAPDEIRHNLASVAQYVATNAGTGPLYEELQEIVDRDYQPTIAHRFVCQLSETITRRVSDDSKRLVIVTTNFDDLLERTFEAQALPYHRVSYIVEGRDSGRFLHRPSGGTPTVVQEPNSYPGLLRDAYPVVIKPFGTIDRESTRGDGFVITEDQHFRLLTGSPHSTLLPVPLRQELLRSGTLALGLALREWTSRANYYQIWGDKKRTFRSWAVLHRPREFDRRYWQNYNVEIIDADLRDCIAELQAQMVSS